MTRHAKLATLATSILAASLLLGCGSEPSAKGSFDRTFTVNGPVRLDMTTGSGDVRVTTGSSGEVRIHGEIQASHWGLEDEEKRINDVKSNPPVTQKGNLVQISGARPGMHNVSIDYTIEVPVETEVHCTTGSGDVRIRGHQGPGQFSRRLRKYFGHRNRRRHHIEIRQRRR